jgi:hypothetical protein
MNLQDAYFEQRFENEFLRARGEAFQTLFERLMSLAYKADFMACRPWGNQGDRKNDGFLKSERRLFQVYAPNEMEAAKAKTKIIDDFGGAREHWGAHFDKWTFVHNATDGLPPHVQQLLLDFEAANPRIRLEPWCLEELRLIFRTLSANDKASWFGPALTDATKLKLGFADLKVVLERIAALPVPPMTDVKDVPTGKIEANALSDAVARLLKEGMVKSLLVADFLARWHDETLGERLAESFKAEYGRLRGALGPNQIFADLQSWAGGGHRGTPEHELAVLTVIAYYFERCDIFEEPREAAR